MSPYNVFLFSILARPIKRPLKVQNGVHEEPDSPVKKFTKRSRQILDSDDEAPAGIEQEPENKAVQPKVAFTFPTSYPPLRKQALIRTLDPSYMAPYSLHRAWSKLVQYRFWSKVVHYRK